MADGVFGRSKQLLLNKFFDPSTPSMSKGRDGGKTGGKKEKRQMKIVATTSLPAVDRPNADRWNAARSRQFHKEGWVGSGSDRFSVILVFFVT